MSTEPDRTAPRSRPDAVDLVTGDHHAQETVVAHDRQQTKRTSRAIQPVSRLLPKRDVGANVRGETDSSLVQPTDHWVAEETGTEAGLVVGPVVRLDTPSQARTEMANVVSLYDDDENPWT